MQRFPDAAVLAAVAESAVATTLVNLAGAPADEIAHAQNRAQSFPKLEMPPDASTYRRGRRSGRQPATASDGIRVPPLRPGLRTNGPALTAPCLRPHIGNAVRTQGEQRMNLLRWTSSTAATSGRFSSRISLGEQAGGNTIAADGSAASGLVAASGGMSAGTPGLTIAGRRRDRGPVTD